MVRSLWPFSPPLWSPLLGRIGFCQGCTANISSCSFPRVRPLVIDLSRSSSLYRFTGNRLFFSTCLGGYHPSSLLPSTTRLPSTFRCLPSSGGFLTPIRSPSSPPQGTRSLHCLELYYVNGQYACGMTSPMAEYFFWSWICVQPFVVLAWIMHSNYYYGGTFIAPRRGKLQVIEESWW